GAEFTINKRDATWTATADSKTYGDSDPSPQTTDNGINSVAGAGVTATKRRGAGGTASPRGQHITATISSTVAWSLSDYNDTNAGAEFTINPKALTITANNKSKQYSDPLPALDATYNGFVPGQDASALGGTLSCTSTATASSGPGTYPITCSGQTSSNYAITYVTGSTITVTQEDARVTYAGNIFVGIPLSSTSATITLIATISDITAMGPYSAGPPVTGDTAYDP